MNLVLPETVLARPPGSLIPYARENQAVVFIREDEWGLRKYPAKCAVDVQLARWKVDRVLVFVVLVRLARSDVTTFESWANVADPTVLRLFQKLAAQSRLDVHIVTDRIARTFSLDNPLGIAASQLVAEVRRRRAWTLQEFERAQQRLCTLYPSPQALWWACQEALLAEQAARRRVRVHDDAEQP